MDSFANRISKYYSINYQIQYNPPFAENKLLCQQTRSKTKQLLIISDDLMTFERRNLLQ